MAGNTTKREYGQEYQGLPIPCPYLVNNNRLTRSVPHLPSSRTCPESTVWFREDFGTSSGQVQDKVAFR